MTQSQPEPSRTVRDADRAALERLLGTPEMAWLVARTRGRVLAAGGEPLRGVVQLNEPSAEQRAAVVRLVGRPKRGGSTLRVDLAVVEEILRRGPWPAGLADAVQTLTGPVLDHRAEREREAAAWDAARDLLIPTTARFPQLEAWWHHWCAAGGLKRAARAEAAGTSATPSPGVGSELVSRLAAVLELLPASGEPLAVLARRAVGDAHGLDSSRPLGRLAAAVVEAAFTPGAAEAPAESSSRDGPGVDSDMSTREVWAAAGVVLSNVASTVLCLGVPGAGPSDAGSDARRTATATSLEAMRAARMPVLLTLDQVRSGGVRALAPGSAIHICENPTVVEVVAERWARSVGDSAEGTASAAGASGAAGSSGMAGTGSAADPVGPVLVCTSGQPSTAVVELVRILAADGAECRYHGDFDWPGLRIARSLSMHVAWVPWRYTASDYRAAVHDGSLSRRLTGSPAQSPWDPELAATMAECDLAVEEEAVAHLLAADLLSADRVP